MAALRALRCRTKGHPLALWRLTRHEILDAVWGTDYLADRKVVDQARHIRTLRLKLKNG